MPNRRTAVAVSVAALSFAALYSAHYVIGEVKYLHAKLSASSAPATYTPQWPAIEPILPTLYDVPASALEDGVESSQELVHQSPDSESQTVFAPSLVQ